jgi:hypothetical protein
MTAVFLEVAADVADEKGPVYKTGDQETDCGEGPDEDGKEHEGEHYSLDGSENALVDVNVKGKVLGFDDRV